MTNSRNYRRHNFDVSFFLSQSGNHKLKNVDRLEMAGIVFTTYIGVFFFFLMWWCWLHENNKFNVCSDCYLMSLQNYTSFS